MLLRSLLFVPGNSLRMITKAATTNADAVILDLEDSVAPADKATARIISRDALMPLKSNGLTTLVRVNSVASGLMDDDLEYVVQEHLDAVMLPKAEDASELLHLDRALRSLEKDRGVSEGSISVLPIIESALGVLKAYFIAAASQRVLGLAFGAGDYCRDMGRNPAFVSEGQEELLYARSQIATSAVAAKVAALDTVFFGQLSDRQGFERESRLALRLGFTGKSVIHPSQIELTNHVFLPSEREVEYARGLVGAFEKAQAAGSGAVAYEGRMIDIMSVRQAQDLLRRVEDASGAAGRGGRTVPPLFWFFEERSSC